MSKRIFTLAAIAIAAAAFSPLSNASHSWNNYHWARTASPFTLQVIDSATSDWDSELVASLNEWSQADPVDLIVTSADDAKGTRKRCAMQPGQMRVCNAAYGYNGWLGLATIGLDANGHIDQGTTQVNDSYASYWTIAGEKNHVMCQEIGHVLGLTHTSEDGSSQQTCMDYSSDINSQWPNQHDYDELAIIYSHLDTYNSYDDGSSGGGGGGGGGCNAPAGKGCNKVNAGEVPPMGVRVYRGPHGKFEIWVAPREGGGLWIHHVRLAPEAN